MNINNSNNNYRMDSFLTYIKIIKLIYGTNLIKNIKRKKRQYYIK